MKRFICVAAGLMFYSFSAWAEPKIQEIKTPSGYTVWLAEDHALPIVTYSFLFEQSGAAYDPAGKEGLASFLTQMLDEGAGDMNSLQFHQTLENKAIRYSAVAGEDSITVTAQTLSEYKTEALNLLLLTLVKPRLDNDAVERIRSSIVSDLAQLAEEPTYIASRTWKELAFSGHPYAHPRRGTAASLQTITAEDMRQFAKEHFFAATGPIIAVAGDITAEEIAEWKLPTLATSSAPKPLPTLHLPDGEGARIVPHDVPQTVVIASFPGLMRDDPRYYALQVLNYVLGGNSITSRLGMQVRNQRGLAYHIGTDIEVMDKVALLSANFATRNAAAHEALSVFTSVVSDIADKGITEQELQDAKHYLIGSFPLEHDTQGEMANFLVGIQHFHLGIDYPEKRNSLIERVTLQDVNTLAKTLLSHHPLVVMTGKPEAATDATANP